MRIINMLIEIENSDENLKMKDEEEEIYKGDIK